ncbi:hypothetical protein QL285_091905 [Trifolium repens]|nr:hypothetical protein QL285_091905 [Trifolium repens]
MTNKIRRLKRRHEGPTNHIEEKSKLNRVQFPIFYLLHKVHHLARDLDALPKLPLDKGSVKGCSTYTQRIIKTLGILFLQGTVVMPHASHQSSILVDGILLQEL